MLGRHRHAHHLEQMPIADIGGVVNNGAALPYSSTEIMSILKVHILITDACTHTSTPDITCSNKNARMAK